MLRVVVGRILNNNVPIEIWKRTEVE